MPNAPQAEERPVAEQTTRPSRPDQEYWKPILPSRQAQWVEPVKHCPACGKDFAAGANFCHGCGAARKTFSGESKTDLMGTGNPILRTFSSALFAVGLAFGLIAAILGSVYSPLDFNGWQALQSWRTEWLLGAVVAFLASLCLKIEA